MRSRGAPPPDTRTPPLMTGAPRADKATTDTPMVTAPGRAVKRHRAAFPDRSFRALQRLGAQAFEAFLDVDGLPIGRWSSR